MFSLSPFTCPNLFPAQTVALAMVMYVCGHEALRACTHFFSYVCLSGHVCVRVCVCSQLQTGYFQLVATVSLRFGWLKAPLAL